MRELLRMFWIEPRVPTPRAPTRGDWLLFAIVCALGGLELSLRPELSWRAPEVLVSFALMPCLLWWRARPFTMVSLAFGACTLLTFWHLISERVATPLNTMVFLLLLPCALFRWGAGREALLGAAITLLAASSDMAVGPTEPGELVGGFAVLLAACAIGTALRFRDRAHERGIAQAKLREREQLARDLHDSVAHHVSAIAIRAQAGLAVADRQPEAAREALRVIASEASRTLAEMRAIVRGLRQDEAAELAPQPRIADLSKLAQRAEGPALSVALSGDVDALPAPLSLAIYRLAQESITNARRHARHATRIEVGVRAEAAAVHLEVRDDGELPARANTPGYGLIGMSERAQLLGGSCTAGPAPERGWTVSVVLPRTGSRA